MSLLEPRCLVCGSPLDRGAPFEKTVRKSEVCSDECFEVYMYDEDNEQSASQPNKKILAELLPPVAKDAEDDAWVKGTQIP